MEESKKCVFDVCPVSNGMCKDGCKAPNSDEAKLVGIACDKYKTNKFKKTLKKKGFVHFEVKEQSKMMDVIKVAVHSKDIRKIQSICQEVELYFKNRN